MIHDLILSCLVFTRKGLSIKGILDSTAIDHFVHPCERETFVEILNILKYFNEVASFVQKFDISKNPCSSIETDEFSKGSYLKNFASGVGDALDDHYNMIAQLEEVYYKSSTNSLMYVYDALRAQLPVVFFLRKLIRDTQLQKLHGCCLLQNLYQQSNHGDISLERAIIKVLTPVKLSFVSHLANWLMFGIIDDEHSEFFIKFTPCFNDSISTGGKSAASYPDQSISCDDYIWQYEINMQQLPGFISTSLAEKIVFVGQTVLVFKMDRSSTNGNKTDLWQMTLCESTRENISELWSGKQYIFQKMVEELANDDKISVVHFEKVVYDIKKYVSMRLSEIAKNKVNLEHQMELIKDFYLLGRGEFYLEFLRQLNGATKGNSELHYRNYTRSFEVAAHIMGMTDDLEHFSLIVQNSNVDFDGFCEFDIFQNFYLKYIYKWPLNLLFSPKVVKQYNKVFRFLLVLRKLQYDLHLVWANHTSAAKRKQPINGNVLKMRNYLMFFLDNLQYYIQVDVVESQFSILMDTIRSKADFGEIQRAHTVFLANVLSQCFLLFDGVEMKVDINQSTCCSDNSINRIIVEIFYICGEFITINYTEDTTENTLKDVEQLEERFDQSIASLMKMLDTKSASNLGPLTQLLLRLDYNHWFSRKRSQQ
ncbi:gamma-tubulin complex component 4 homolog [Scaptodrosophila lebanonensis]|uniref:Gamma-tubulin complex component n=1 Tax=Drosophila lebanonensis TaxID=7225 RepID=A0A6J2U9Y7_DROLE|nr:gamma-tubulin complex component 4 homolog [Scaptodrosophila lebanonensis]